MRDTSPIDALKEYLDRWAAAHLSCEPADRRTAEEGVREAYASAGLAPPRRIVWCGGPLEIAQHLAAASPDDLIGANVKAEIFDQVRNRVGTFAEVFWKEVVVAATELSDHKSLGAAIDDYNRCKAVSAAINRVVRNAADDSLSGLRLRARHVARRLRGQPRLLPRCRIRWGGHGASRCCFARSLRIPPRRPRLAGADAADARPVEDRQERRVDCPA